MDDFGDEETDAWVEQVPTWWCDEVDVLGDLVAMTLRQLEDADIETVDEGRMWFVEAHGCRCLVSVQDLERGVEVSAALAYDVPDTPGAAATVLGFNRTGSPARHWLTECRILMAANRVSARPFVGAHLVEAIQIAFAASAEAHHAAVACGGVPAIPVPRHPDDF